MSTNSKIEWTDHTFNPWIGCTKVSAGCANCYAERREDHRLHRVKWGAGQPRHRTKTWGEPLKWNREAGNRLEAGKQEDRKSGGARGEGGAFVGAEPRAGGGGSPAVPAQPHPRPRVFSASLADWLDDEVPIEWLADFLALIHAAPNLDWLLLTKRPQNWRKRLDAVADWLGSSENALKAFEDEDEQASQIELYEFVEEWMRGIAPANVWLGTSVEDQRAADERIPHLLAMPARVRFLSCEPLLGPVDLSAAVSQHSTLNTQLLHWVIAGGESGPGARPMHPAWARGLRDQCAAAGVAFFFKQWGEFAPDGAIEDDGSHFADSFRRNAQVHICEGGERVYRVGKKRAGRLLDGREHNALPSAGNAEAEQRP